MKKSNLFKCVLTLLVTLFFINEISVLGITIISTPKDSSYVGVQYIDTVIADEPVLEKLPVTYSLDEKPDGMVINSVSGRITWTPLTITSGGKVIVRATNNDSEYVTQEYFLYVSDAIPCPVSLEAYWKFDEESGPPYVDWFGINNAVVAPGANAPSDTTGIVDVAQAFDFENEERLNVASNPVFNWDTDESFSIEFWFRKNTASFDSVAIIVGRNEGPHQDSIHWWVGFLDNNHLAFVIRTGVDAAICESNSAITNTDWHYVSAVRDALSDNIKLYIDNLTPVTASYDGSGPGLISWAPLNIGWLTPRLSEHEYHPFNGSIDELRIHNAALNDAFIANSYSKGLLGKPACADGNFAPLFTSTPVNPAYEDRAYTYALTANDRESGVITDFTVVDKPDWLGFNDVTNTLYGIPVNDDVGSETVLITVTDPAVPSLVVDHEYLLYVINTNDPPAITSSPVLTVNEEEAYSYDVDASDIDVGDHLVFSAPEKPAWLSINGSTGVLSGTPPVDDTTQYDITVRVTDDSASFDEQSFVLDVRNVNDAPEITGQPELDVDEDSSILIGLDDIYYTDVDNAPGDLTLTVKDGTDYTHTGNLVTPSDNFNGTLSVPVDLSDLEYTDSYTLTITVNSINDVPVITSTPDADAYENQQYIYVFEAEDVESTVTYSSIKKPDWLTFIPASGLLSGKPDFFDAGTDSVVLMATDGTANVYDRFTVTVHITNNIPYITSTPVTSVDEDTEYSYTVTYTDADPLDVLTLSKLEPSDGWLELNGNVLSGTPDNSQVGIQPSVDYTVKLRIFDGKQDSTQTFKITVYNVNDAPVISGQPDTLYAYAGTTLTIALSDLNVTDVDNVPGDLSVIVMPGSNYTNSGNSAIISQSALGIIHVNVRVSDGVLQSTTYSAYVRVYEGTGINEKVYSGNLVNKLYPVPANDFLVFEINPAVTGLYFELISMQGQTVAKHKIQPDENIFKLDLNDISSGIYFYKFFNRNNYQTGKVTIQK